MASTINFNSYPYYDYVALQYVPGSLNSGDTAWMLAATAIVLFMTMPGLAIYYSGMVRDKNVLACKSPHSFFLLPTSFSHLTLQLKPQLILLTYLLPSSLFLLFPPPLFFHLTSQLQPNHSIASLTFVTFRFQQALCKSSPSLA